ncbi:MAG TPA: ABC transporter ATP-binding protein [Candidatus Xenobia bacterium]|jgi:ABC-type sugar transport system ATPase subunit
MTGIEFRGVIKKYGTVTALQEVNLKIEPGEFFTLLGPSGSGKTTLLRLLAGLETVSGGQLLFDNEDVTNVPPWKRQIAMVFQNYALYPHMTVAQNIEYPLKLRKVPKAESDKRVQEVADALQIGHLLARKPTQISGGQQQRVALARALSHKPRLFLFDEPLSNLDARLRLDARAFIKNLQRQLNITSVYVTHDQSEAMALSDRMAVLAHGVMKQVGTPQEVYHKPSDAFVAAFVGSPPMNLLKAEGVGEGVRLAGHVLKTDTPPPSGKMLLGVRPEALQWINEGPVPAKVVVSEDFGHETLITVDIEGQHAVVRSTGVGPETGAVGAVSIRMDRACFYPDTD